MTLTARALSGDGTVQTSSDSTQVTKLIAQGTAVWIDAEGGEGDLGKFLTEVLHLHPLAVEDIVEGQQIPKAEDYGDYLYLVVLSPPPAGSTDAPGAQLDVVLGRTWVFTHHREPSRAVSAVTGELEKRPKALQRGPAFVAHALLDHLVDDYLPLMDILDDQVEGLEAAVVASPSQEVLQQLFGLKRSLQHLRRTSVHQREILQRLARGEFEQVPGEALPFFRDVFDHFVRVGDLADSYRELLSNDLDAYLSVVSNRMNEVMKTLTMVATVVLPMNFLVGLYGMNFANMPELHWRYGYLYFWGLLIALTAGTVGWLRLRKWV